MNGPTALMFRQVIVYEPYVSSVTYIESPGDEDVNKEWELLQKEELFTKLEWEERRKNCEKVASKQMDNWYERENLYEGMKLTYGALIQRDKASAENYQIMQNLKLEIAQLVTRVNTLKGKNQDCKQGELQLREKLKQYKLLIYQIRLWGDNYYELRLMYTTFEAKWSYLKGVDKDEYILGICFADWFVEPKELDDVPMSHPEVHPAFAYFHQLFDSKPCLVPVADSTKQVVFQKPLNNQPNRNGNNVNGNNGVQKCKYKMLKKRFGKELKQLEEKLRLRWKPKQPTNNERRDCRCEVLYQIYHGEDIPSNPRAGPKTNNSSGNQTNSLEILERDFRNELEELDIKMQKIRKNENENTSSYGNLEELLSELVRENHFELMGYHEYTSKMYQNVREELDYLCTTTSNLKQKAKENKETIASYNKRYEELNTETREYKKKRKSSPVEKMKELGHLVEVLDELVNETELIENSIQTNEKRIAFLLAVETIQDRRKRKGPLTPKKQDPTEPIFNPYMLTAYEDLFKSWGKPYDEDDNVVEDLNKILFHAMEKEGTVSNNSWYECTAMIGKISEIIDEQNLLICSIRDCNVVIRDSLHLGDTEAQIAKLNMAEKQNLVHPFSNLYGKENALADIYLKFVKDCLNNQCEWRRTGGHITKLFLILESIIQEAKILNLKISRTERKAKNEQKRKGKQQLVRFKRDEEKYRQNYDILIEKLKCIISAEIQYFHYLDEFKAILSKTIHDESLSFIKRIINNEIPVKDPSVMGVATNANQVQQACLQVEGQQPKNHKLPSSLENEVSKAIANFSEVVDQKHTQFLHKILEIGSTHKYLNREIYLPPLELKAPTETVAQQELPENAPQSSEGKDCESEEYTIERKEQNVETLNKVDEETNNLQQIPTEPEQETPIQNNTHPNKEQVHNTLTNESLLPVTEPQSSQCSTETSQSSNQEKAKEIVETPESVFNALKKDEPVVNELSDTRMYEKYVQIGKKLIQNGEEFDRMADRVNQINDRLSRLEEVMVSKLDCLQNTMVNNFTQFATQLQKDVTEQVIIAVKTLNKNNTNQGTEPILNVSSQKQNFVSEEKVNLENKKAKNDSLHLNENITKINL